MTAFQLDTYNYCHIHHRTADIFANKIKYQGKRTTSKNSHCMNTHLLLTYLSSSVVTASTLLSNACFFCSIWSNSTRILTSTWVSEKSRSMYGSSAHKTRIAKPGPGKGCRITMSIGSPRSFPIALT